MGKSEDKKSVWKEQVTFEEMIDDLTTSSSRIKKATRFCIKHHKWYKHIVKIIERFATKWKSQERQKLPIFYIIDGVLRKLQRDKNETVLKKFSKRFDRNIITTVKNLITVSLEKERPKMKRVVCIWTRQKKLFSSSNIKSLKELVKAFPSPDDRTKSATRSPPKSPLPEELPLPDQDGPVTSAGENLEVPSTSVRKTPKERESSTIQPAIEDAILLDFPELPSVTETSKPKLKPIVTINKNNWKPTETTRPNLKRKLEQPNQTLKVKKKKLDDAEVQRSKYLRTPKIEERPRSPSSDTSSGSLTPLGGLTPLGARTPAREESPSEPEQIERHPGYVIKEDDPTGTTGLSTCIWTQFSQGEGSRLKTHCEQLGDLVDFHIVKDGEPSEAFISFRTRSAALNVKMNLLKGSLQRGSKTLPQLMKVGWGKTPGLIDFDFSSGLGKLVGRI